MNVCRPAQFEINTCNIAHLDLTLASPALARNWQWDALGENSMGSGHFPVLSKFGRSLVMDSGDEVKRFDFARAEWDKFTEGTR